MKNSTQRYLRSQRGLSLVELLIAAAVGLILLGGVYKLFVSSSDTYSMDEQLARVQENGRFALDFITRDLRMAGFRGCAGTEGNLDCILNGDCTGFNYAFDQYIGGSEADSPTTWTPALDAGLTSPLGGSDVITVRGIAAGNIPITTDMPSTSATMFVPAATTGIAVGDIMMVSDCKEVRVFQVTHYNVSGGAGNVEHNSGATEVPGNSVAGLGYEFPPGAEVFNISTTTYYVRNLDAGGNVTEPTLYRKVGIQAAEAIVEGVENIQIRYGLDSTGDGGVNTYDTADNIEAAGTWNQVVAVRLFLLVRSPNDVLHGELDALPANYAVFGLANPGDRRLRMVYSTTIGLRNRLP